MNTAPSKEDLIEGLKSFAEEINNVPTVRGMRSEGPYSSHYYKEKFGSWHNALRAADIQPTHGVDPDVDRETLVEELKKVSDTVGRSPRRRDIDEHGEYSYVLYVQEFESFIYALEEAGIDPDERQYRFSLVDTPEEKKISQNIEKLRNDGPTPSTELPQGKGIEDRRQGIAQFRIHTGVSRTEGIYYIDGEHAPESVIRQFFQSNPQILNYRNPRGIKTSIGKYQPSWKEIGREIVDELIDEGLAPAAKFKNLAVIKVHSEKALKYCFDSSVSTPVDMAEVSSLKKDYNDYLPVWGFSEENKEIWEVLSKQDGVLFSTRSGMFTHYVPVKDTFKNSNIMAELWVEYENGTRSGGIEIPQPYLVVGEDMQKISIQEEEFTEETDTNLSTDSIQLLDEEAMKPLLNRYGGFESYLHNRGFSNGYDLSDNFNDNPSTQELIDILLQVTDDNLIDEEISELETIERKKREDAFQMGIYEIYPRCAICGGLVESPKGGHNLEAAHILPKAQEGPDILQNGLGLCPQHHWAFDQGWFKIGVDYEIHVRDYPDLKGYSKLKKCDGSYLQVPSEEELRPYPQYIRQRNQLHKH